MSFSVTGYSFKTFDFDRFSTFSVKGYPFQNLQFGRFSTFSVRGYPFSKPSIFLGKKYLMETCGFTYTKFSILIDFQHFQQGDTLYKTFAFDRFWTFSVRYPIQNNTLFLQDMGQITKLKVSSKWGKLVKTQSIWYKGKAVKTQSPQYRRKFVKKRIPIQGRKS